MTDYPQGYWDFLLRLHEIWGMKQQINSTVLILEERTKLKEKKPTYNCLKHCEMAKNDTLCAGFIYDDTTIFNEKKAEAHVSYLKFLNLQKDEVREAEKKKEMEK